VYLMCVFDFYLMCVFNLIEGIMAHIPSTSKEVAFFA
jgi:hypothetical protein